MKVRVFHLAEGRAKSASSLIKEALSGKSGSGNAAPDYSSILHIVPSSLCGAERMRAFHKIIGRRCYIPPVVVTLRQLALRLNESHGERAVVPSRLTPVVLAALSGKGMGLAAITAKFISEMKHLLCSGSHEAAKEAVGKVFADLDMPEAVSDRVIESLGLFAEYQQALEASARMDEDDALLAAPELTAKMPPVSALIVDGLYEATSAERAFIISLINKAERAIISVPEAGDVSGEYLGFIRDTFRTEESRLLPEETPGPLSFHPFASLEEEMEAVARHIKSGFFSGRKRQLDSVIVAFPSLGSYRDTSARVFEKYGIPHSFEKEKPLSASPAFADMTALLEAVRNDYPRLEFSRFLASPYFDGIGEELRTSAPAFCLRADIIKGKERWLRAFKAQGAHQAGTRLFKKLEPLAGMSSAPLRKHVETLLEVLSSLRFNSGDDSPDLREILRPLGAVDDLTGRPSDIQAFTEAVRHMLENSFPETEERGVRLVNSRSAYASEPDFLYFCGLKDGDIPSMPDIDHLLPEGVRSRLGLRTMARHLETEAWAFRRLSATGNVYLTYPTMEADKFYLPSILLAGAQESADRVSGIMSEEEALIARGSVPLTAHIKEINVKAAGRRYLSGIRVTDVDSYRRCPRLYFIEKALKLEPASIKEYALDAKQMGIIVHKVMEAIIPAGDSAEEFYKKASSAMDSALKEAEIEPYWGKVLKDSFMAEVPAIYELEADLSAGGSVFMKSEVAADGEPIKGIKLKGKIDRINLKGAEGAVEILDYKTGTADLSGSRVFERGEALQLFLYSALLRCGGLKAERVGIYSVSDIKIKWVPGRNDVKAGRTIEDFEGSAMRYLMETALMMRHGSFTASPIDDRKVCRECHERPFCPFIQCVGARGGGP